MSDANVGTIAHNDIIAEEFQTHIRNLDRRNRMMQVAPIIVLVVIFIIFAIGAPGFISVKNFFNLLNQMSIPLIVATGITFVVLIGSIDLSVDGVMGLSGAMAGLLVLNDKTPFNLGFFGVIIAVLIAGLCGFVTGLISVKGKIPSFMVSFAMSSITYGFAMLSYGALPPIINDTSVRAIALTKIGNLPIFFYIAVVLFVVALIVQDKTATGKHIYAIGENESLAKISGVNVDKVKIAVFALAGLFVGVGGICGAAQLGRGDVSVGTGMVFPALAAVVVGGTSLAGGKGGVQRTLIGVLIITILNNGLVLIGANAYFKDGIVGIILIIAVVTTISRNSKMVAK
ncbi:MAG: ABC transporter permease [Clostridiales Family XIII bacterium]|jgi:ribose transport system permease protein|nr:ABC transporter permease [Clostridiales Family XIII bacterium]